MCENQALLFLELLGLPPTRKDKCREVCLAHRLPDDKGKLTKLVSVKRTNSNYYDVVTKKFAFTIPVLKKQTNKRTF